MEYFVTFWGGAEPVIEEELGITEKNHWFSKKEDRARFMKKLKTYEHLGLAFRTWEGETLTHKRTVAKVEFSYDGNTYRIDHDYGYEFPEEVARYMFESGDYVCDCDKSLLIQARCDAEFPEFFCGDKIKLKDIKIEFK